MVKSGRFQKKGKDEPEREHSSPASWLWAKVGLVLAGIAGLAALSTQLVTIGEAFPKIFPFWAPFDASILIRDIRLEKVVPVSNSFGGQVAEPAVEVHIEYVEEKTGPSVLKACHPELHLQDVYQTTTWPAQSQTIPEPTQAKVIDIFIVRKAHYSQSAALRMVCEKRITGWRDFQLPEVAGINIAQTSTYFVCLGEFSAACGGTQNWAPCGTDVTSWAKSTHAAECVNVDAKKISDVSGNRCGYATFQVTCSTK